MSKLTDKINSINELGRANLAEKGVDIPESATTYEIMQSIAEVSSGGASYTSVVNAVGLYANDIIVPTVTITTNELKANNISVVGLSAIDIEE